MAVCNLFSGLSNASGNFMMFSQYVEDVTRNTTEGDNWKVVPTGFVALDIDYSSINKTLVLNDGREDLNSGLPKYMQNCFENACAYGRSHYSEWTEEALGTAKPWTPEVARNLFWNSMFDGGLLHAVRYGSESSNAKYIPEVVYYGDISMHSYNEHQGMGYGEIYCYIPTDAPKMNCQVQLITDEDPNGRLYDYSNSAADKVEGYNDIYLEGYPQVFAYNRDFAMSFDDDTIAKLQPSTDSRYNINTVVVLYGIFRKINEDWEPLYSSLPMGMYITGRFDNNEELTNKATKYVTTSYGVGTSYGLRICTRFSATSAARLINTDVVVDDSGYTNMCQLMTAMNENLSRMLEISKAAHDTTQSYKETLASIKNNRTNVPYVKEVNGVDCWFVNGRFVAKVDPETCGINQLAPETVRKRLNNLDDSTPDNDWTYIEDTNGCDIMEFPIREVAGALGLNPEDYPEYGGGTTGGDVVIGGISDEDIADDMDVINALNGTQQQ